MPRGPKGEKRPRDANQLAKLIVDIATGQVEVRDPTPEERGVDPAASAMGRKGGPARAASMTPEKRFAVLQIPPIMSPLDAVRAAIVAEHRHAK
jgi:hypothetical protein